ncbi:hypothetical protein QMK33_03580 [Hymenobacter sp. H14-R3]|uniref:hypothetical protein n=1 Tax=Hymenobacter sp. H14-R3 TaxID=3046308 RepID=UPI0024BBBDAF|nr:hypothetical protein [Hymenobacter sp. H14-R3]MDJ0364218.1 hypothetical protein [Hymenobacter sp. H14-R3]
MKHLVLSLSLLLATLPAVAQVSSPGPAARPDSLAAALATAPAVPDAAPAPAFAAPDTVAALHQLFERGRARRRRLVFGALGIGGGLTAFGLFSKPATNDPLDAGLTRLFGVAVGVTTTAIVAAGMIGFDQYSRLNEKQALMDLQNNALPKRVRRQLTPAYFEPYKPGPGRR